MTFTNKNDEGELSTEGIVQQQVRQHELKN